MHMEYMRGFILLYSDGQNVADIQLAVNTFKKKIKSFLQNVNKGNCGSKLFVSSLIFFYFAEKMHHFNWIIKLNSAKIQSWCCG